MKTLGLTTIVLLLSLGILAFGQDCEDILEKASCVDSKNKNLCSQTGDTLCKRTCGRCPIVTPKLIFYDGPLSVLLDYPAQLQCGYSPAEAKIRGCVWSDPSNIDFQVEDIYNNLHPGMGRPRNSIMNQCSIILENVSPQDNGNWTCKIFVPGNTLRGTLELHGGVIPAQRSEVLSGEQMP